MITTQLPDQPRLGTIQGTHKDQISTIIWTPQHLQTPNALRGLIAPSSTFMGFRATTWKFPEELAK